MKQITLYIGSPNDTHVIDEVYLDKIVTFANNHWEGYTLLQGRGFWHYTSEDMIVLKLLISSLAESSCCKDIAELKALLRQQDILVSSCEVDAYYA